VDLRAAVDEGAASDIRALLSRAEGADFSQERTSRSYSGLTEAKAAELETTVLSLIGALEHVGAPVAPRRWGTS